MDKRKKFFTDDRIALCIRWWAIGAVYFFVGWGTGLGSQDSVVDFVFFLGVSIALVNIFVVNPVLSKMFHLSDNIKYNDTTVLYKVKSRLIEIFKSILIVLILVYVYTLVNILLIYLMGLPPESVPFAGEPITFGILYMCVHSLLGKTKTKIKGK